MALEPNGAQFPRPRRQRKEGNLEMLSGLPGLKGLLERR